MLGTLDKRGYDRYFSDYNLEEPNIAMDSSNFIKIINLIYQKGYIDCFTQISNEIQCNFEEITSSEQDKGIYNIIMEIIRKNSLSGSSREDSVMIALSNYYNLVNELEIYSFIKENKNINRFLLDAYQQMEKVFGENVEVVLKKKDDPETSNPMLVAYIDTSHLSVKDARKMLRRFKFDWYLKNNERANGRFIVHVT